MRFNSRIGAIGAGAAALIYTMLPQIEEGRFDQVVTFAALWACISLFIGWAAYELEQIKRRRNSLEIISKRPVRGNRDALKTDIRLRKKSWIITFPVEKVVD
jgi:hypothetical protein